MGPGGLDSANRIHDGFGRSGSENAERRLTQGVRQVQRPGIDPHKEVNFFNEAQELPGTGLALAEEKKSLPANSLT